MESIPDACILPVPQTAPAGDAGPTPHLERWHLPLDTGPQHEPDPGQCRAIRNPAVCHPVVAAAPRAAAVQ